MNEWMSANSLHSGRDILAMCHGTAFQMQSLIFVSTGAPKNDCILIQALNGMLPPSNDSHMLLSIVIIRVGTADLESV